MVVAALWRAGGEPEDVGRAGGDAAVAAVAVVGAGAGGPEGDVVEEDGAGQVELVVTLRVVPGEIVEHADRAWVAVPGEAVLAVSEGDGTGDGVGDGDVLAAELEAVAVAGGVLGAVGKGAVIVCDALVDDDGADGAGGGLGEQVPAVVDVVVRNAAAENVARAGGELAGETVGVFAATGRQVVVVVGLAVEDEVVRRPLRRIGGGGGVASDLEAGVAVVMGDATLDDVGIARDIDAVVGRTEYFQAPDVPVVAVDLQAARVCAGAVGLAGEVDARQLRRAAGRSVGEEVFTGGGPAADVGACDGDLVGENVGAAAQVDDASGRHESDGACERGGGGEGAGRGVGAGRRYIDRGGILHHDDGEGGGGAGGGALCIGDDDAVGAGVAAGDRGQAEGRGGAAGKVDRVSLPLVGERGGA